MSCLKKRFRFIFENLYLYIKEKEIENTEIPMAERLTAIQNFGFLVKIPIAESLTPVQVFYFMVL